MTAASDIAAIADEGNNTPEDVRTALTSVLAVAELGNFGASIYDSSGTSQTITTATTTTVTFDTERRDDRGDVANLANNRVDIPLDGWYSIVGGVRWGTIGSGAASVRFYKNGSLLKMIQLPAAAATGAYMTLTATEYLADGDYIDLRVNQSSGSDASVLTGSSYESYLDIAAMF